MTFKMRYLLINFLNLSLASYPFWGWELNPYSMPNRRLIDHPNNMCQSVFDNYESFVCHESFKKYDVQWSGDNYGTLFILDTLKNSRQIKVK